MPTCSLKRWTLADCEAFHSIWGDARVIWWGAAADISESQEKLRTILERQLTWPNGCGWWQVVAADGDVVGNVVLQPCTVVPGTIEIGWHVRFDAQGRGYASSAAEVLIERARDSGMAEITATIVPDNEASRRVATKVGMHIDGEQVMRGGLLHDVWRIRL